MHDFLDRLKRKHFPTRCDKQLLHVLPALFKPPSRYALDHVVTGSLLRSAVAHAHSVEMLNPCDLVASCAVVFRQLCLDDNFWIEFIGDDEVRCLLKSLDTLGALCFPGADAMLM